MKHLKKLFSILMGCALITSAFTVFSSKKVAEETKADDPAVLYETDFAGVTAGQTSTSDGFVTFNKAVDKLFTSKGPCFVLGGNQSFKITFHNSLFQNPDFLGKVELKVNPYPQGIYDSTRYNSASFVSKQGDYTSSKKMVYYFNQTDNSPNISYTQDLGNKKDDVEITVTNERSVTNEIYIHGLKIYESVKATMSITGGAGISSVYVSMSQDALSGYASGTKLPTGNIYAFAVLADGYKHRDSWVKVSDGDDDVAGAIYRVGSYMNAGLDYDFGTIDAIAKQTKQQVYIFDYSVDDMPIADHEFNVGDGAYVMPATSGDNYHIFKEWNSAYDGSGLSFGATITAEQVDSIARGENGIEYLFAIYNFPANIQAFFDKVESIPDPLVIGETCETPILEAIEMYEAFTPEEKEVPEVGLYYEGWLIFVFEDYIALAIDEIGHSGDPTFEANLEKVEELLDKFPDDHEEDIDLTKVEVARVEHDIDEIGTVTYPDSRDDISKARDGYEDLTETQQPEVVNYQDLLDDEVEFVELEIDEIGTVTLEKEDEIVQARDDYEELSDEQQPLVENYNTLVEAEESLQDQKDQQAADGVVALINNIGEVAFTTVSKEKIDAARAGYEALTSTQKPLVSNYGTLVAAEARYAELAAAASDKVTDSSSGVSIKTDDGTKLPSNISIKVEVKTTVSAEEGSADYDTIQSKIGNEKQISGVYEVKLILTDELGEHEIQPSDIKEGMTITVTMAIPEGVAGEFEILHIHSSDEIGYLESFSINGNEVSFSLSKLSEFAFITKVPASVRAGLPGWAIALIIIGVLLLLLCGAYFLLFFVFNKWIKDEKEDDKALRVMPFAFGHKDGEDRLLVFPCKIAYRAKEEIFEFKEDALRS